MEENNPWAIDSIFEMQYFNCPSCNFRTQSKQSFVEHAFEANRRYISGEMTLPTFHEGALNQYEFRYTIPI